ncbi:concanavalin A-like lectin/glucanase domain-containing protein [Leptodontidium sp. 2 PMI_412]|nr:concanavalin A-like lectin/glucanase domain-containing protein [Leptodontidium sp. MPI-SDFR-AT-0119]KAH9209720.1 concanavalin A-like lectin/glucanase domain-containing protein [Leptodontidium sp. 2 PMI_412]
MTSSIIKAAVLALALSVQVDAAQYLLVDDFSGPNFYNNFDFITVNDPTGGFVDYQTQSAALSKGLIGYNPTAKRSYMGVDSAKVLSPVQSATNRGRASVRIESKKKYTRGMFIADLYHVPQQACGIWPAFWTVGHENYPRWGEIDIFENINENSQSLHVLHTDHSSVCTIPGNQLGTRQTSVTSSFNCDDTATTGPFGTTQSVNQGCAATTTGNGNYGSSFNANGGGIVAMEWTTKFIKMWTFPPNAVPANIKSGKPDTSTWGTPSFTTEGGNCIINDHFKDHNIVFDTTFCGNYAGQDYFWKQTSCYKNNPTKYAKCTDYVAANPAAFQQAYWIINSVKVYQWQF